MQCLSFYFSGIAAICWILFSKIKQVVKRQLTLPFCCRCGLQCENCHGRSHPGSAAALGHGWTGTVRKALLCSSPGSQPSCVAAPSSTGVEEGIGAMKVAKLLVWNKSSMVKFNSVPVKMRMHFRVSLPWTICLKIIKCGPNPASQERLKYRSIPNRASGTTV